MCPLPPVSLLIDIDVHSTDEEVIEYLERRRVWDPIPSNVVTEVNPYSIDPRNSPEGIWFLYSPEDSHCHVEGSIIEVTNGYWRSMSDLSILSSTPTLGRKTTRDFYVGQAPSGDRTLWRMHEYQVEQDYYKSQDKSTLCRFFLQDDERLDAGEQCNPVNPGDAANGEYLDSMLLGFLEEHEEEEEEEEEEEINSREASNGSLVIGEDDQTLLKLSCRPPENLANGEFMGDIQGGGYDFSKEDFLELKDLYDPMSSSSSSDNSSLMSMNSDECFDAEALLRDIENEGDLNLEQHIGHKYSVTTAVNSDQVIVGPPSPSAFGDNSNLVVSANVSANSSPVPDAAPSSSVAELRGDCDKSPSASSRGSSQDSSNSSRSGSKSLRRMAKLGKRYCCFRSFDES